MTGQSFSPKDLIERVPLFPEGYPIDEGPEPIYFLQSRLFLWWINKNKEQVFLTGSVGIEKVETDWTLLDGPRNPLATVTLVCNPTKAHKIGFINNLDSTKIEVRYTECGRPDNPQTGVVVARLIEIDTIRRWAGPIGEIPTTSHDLNLNTTLLSHIEASCLLEYNYIF